MVRIRYEMAAVFHHVLGAFHSNLEIYLISILLDVRSYVPPVQVSLKLPRHRTSENTMFSLHLCPTSCRSLFGQIGEIMRGAAVGVVIASKSRTFPVGCYVGAEVGWTEYAIVKEKNLERLDLPQNSKITDALGVLGKLYTLQVFINPDIWIRCN